MKELFVQIAFYGFGGLAVLMALVILFTRNVLYAATALLFSFLGVAAIYVLAGSPFLAVTQILVYVGGVLILVLFGVMLTKRTDVSKRVLSGSTHTWLGTVIGLGLLLMVLFTFRGINSDKLIEKRKSDIITLNASYKSYERRVKDTVTQVIISKKPVELEGKTVFVNDTTFRKAVQLIPEQSSVVFKDKETKKIGAGFMEENLLPFELIAIILLIALIGSTYVAAHKGKEEEQ